MEENMLLKQKEIITDQNLELVVSCKTFTLLLLRVVYIIGIGLSTSGDLYYTKNGYYLGPAFKIAKTALHLTIGLKGSGVKVSINYGQKPFCFQFEKLAKFDIRRSTKRKVIQDQFKQANGIEALAKQCKSANAKVAQMAYSTLWAAVGQSNYLKTFKI
jgi:hypothetical protein